MKNTSIFEFVQHDRHIRLHLPDVRDHIQNQIRKHGQFYEQQMLDQIGPRLPKGSLVLDVGANIGNHTVYFSKVLGLSVIAFEPNPRAQRLLKENVRINEVADLVEIHDVALGREDGEANIQDNDPNNLGRASVNTSTALDPANTVQVRRLDDIVANRRPALIKIDVEGMEPEVLRGAEGVIRRHTPLLLIEAATSEQLAEIEALVLPWGYRRSAVYNDTPTYLFRPVRGLSDTASRQIDEWTLSALPPTRRVVAGMATVKGNEKAMLTAIVSLLPQVDQVYLYLNHYDQVPDVLQRFGERVVCRLDPEGTRWGDAGKFFGVEHEQNAIYLTCDDDIEYPTDYVLRMAQALAETRGEQAAGVHAAVLAQPFSHYYDPCVRHVWHFEQVLTRERAAHVLGTGTVAFHTSRIAPGMDAFPSANMADIWFARWLLERGIGSRTVARPPRWLKAIEVSRPTIYDTSRRREGGLYDTSQRQDQVLSAMGPWSYVSKTQDAESGAFLVELRTDEDLENLLETCARQHRDTAIVLVDRRTEGVPVQLRKAPSCETHWIPSGTPLDDVPGMLPGSLRELLQSRGIFLELSSGSGQSRLQHIAPERASAWRSRMQAHS